jgi:hypothetical protein
MGVQGIETLYLENLDRNTRNSDVGEAILYTIRIRLEDSSTRFKETYQLIITSITASNMVVALSTNKALATTGANNTFNGSNCIIQSVSSDRERKIARDIREEQPEYFPSKPSLSTLLVPPRR